MRRKPGGGRWVLGIPEDRAERGFGGAKVLERAPVRGTGPQKAAQNRSDGSDRLLVAARLGLSGRATRVPNVDVEFASEWD